MTVTYEITAMVRADLCDSYVSYMRTRHIPDLIRTGHFVSATLSHSGTGRYRTRYEAADRGSLDLYLAENAPQLWDDFIKHFPDGVELSREEWDVMETFGGDDQLESR